VRAFGMIPRIGFVLEQGLGHVAYGMSLRSALSTRKDIDCVWLEVSFADGPLARIPIIGTNYAARGNLRARHAIAHAHRERALDGLFVHTSMIALFSMDWVARIPTCLSLDATPFNYDELASWYRHQVSSPSVERAKLWAHRSLMRRADRVTVWSEWAKRSLVRDYGVDDRVVDVTAPGATLANFPDPRTRGVRKPGLLRVLFVGGDFVRKGGDLLLEVHRQHLRGKCELHLVTSADIPQVEGVHVYRGMKPHSPELLRLYADADVFVLPTRGDYLAVVLGEAMASSLPIVTTSVGAHAEAVHDGETGYVIPPNDADALRERLLRFAADPELCARMGRASRRLGEARFDMQKNANHIADILVAMSQRSGRRGGD